MIKLNHITLLTTVLILIVFHIQAAKSQSEPIVRMEDARPKNRTELSCQKESFCYTYMMGSHCVNGFCECPSDRVPVANIPAKKGTCLLANEGTPLYAKCIKNEECTNQNQLSYCGNYGANRVCICSPGYTTIVAQDDLRCGKYTGEPCVNSTDCELGVPGSECQVHGGPKNLKLCFCKTGLRFNNATAVCDGASKISAQITFFAVPIIMLLSHLIVHRI